MRCGAAAAVAVAATTQSPLLPPYLPAMAASGLCLPHVAAAWLAARRGAWERNSGCGTLLLFAAGVACGRGGESFALQHHHTHYCLALCWQVTLQLLHGWQHNAGRGSGVSSCYCCCCCCSSCCSSRSSCCWCCYDCCCFCFC